LLHTFSPFLFDTFSPIFNFTKKRKKCQYICAECQFFEKIYLCGERKAKVSSLSIRKALLTYFLFMVDNSFYFFYNGASFIFNNTF